VPKRAHGTEHKNGKRQATELSPFEVRKVLAAVKDPKARAFFTLMYEATLRPATLKLIQAPEHYRRGAAQLHIPKGADKNRLGRTVPLSVAARKALDSVVGYGLIFGPLPYRRPFEKAATKALSEAKAATAHPYDLKRAGITHRLERTNNLPGVQYLAGHKNPSTTGRYVQASMRAAEAAISGTRRRSP
jgi:integrase